MNTKEIKNWIEKQFPYEMKTGKYGFIGYPSAYEYLKDYLKKDVHLVSCNTHPSILSDMMTKEERKTFEKLESLISLYNAVVRFDMQMEGFDNV